MKNRNYRMVVVIGSSRLGASIASSNSQMGAYTAIIDKEPKAFRKLDPDYSGYKIEGDGEDIDVLEEANIREATEIDIMTEDDNENIYLANLCLTFFKAPLIIVRLMDEKKSVLLDDARIRIITPSILSYRTYHEIQDASLPIPEEDAGKKEGGKNI